MGRGFNSLILFFLLWITACSGGSTPDSATTSGGDHSTTGGSTSGGEASTGGTSGSGSEQVFLENCDQCLAVLKSKYFSPLSKGEIFVEDTALDTQGNLILVGYFQTSNINFGGNELNVIALESGDQVRDIFVAKFSPNFDHLWSLRFGDRYRDEGFGVTTDGDNHVYISGTFRGNVSFGDQVFNTQGDQQGFILKLNGGDGSVIWAIEGSNFVPDSYTKHFLKFDHLKYSDQSNRLLFAGFGFYNQNNGESDDFSIGFVGAIDPANGQVIWKKNFQVADVGAVITDLTIFQDKVSVITSFRPHLFLENTYYNILERGAVLAQMKITDGQLLLVKQFELTDVKSEFNSFANYFIRMAQDSEGNYYLAGQMYGPDKFDQTVFQSAYYGDLINSDQIANVPDLFITKLSLDGSVLWGRTFGKPGEEQLKDLEVGSNGGLYLSGSMQMIDESTPGNSEFNHPFLAKFNNSDGSEIFVKEVLSSGVGKSIAIRPDGKLIWSGDYLASLELLDVNLPGASNQGIFVFELLPKQ